MIVPLHITVLHIQAVRAFKNMFYSKSATVERNRKSLETFLKRHHSYTVELIQSVVTHTPEYFCAVQGQTPTCCAGSFGNPAIL